MKVCLVLIFCLVLMGFLLGWAGCELKPAWPYTGKTYEVNCK